MKNEDKMNILAKNMDMVFGISLCFLVMFWFMEHQPELQILPPLLMGYFYHDRFFGKWEQRWQERIMKGNREGFLDIISVNPDYVIFS